MGRGRNRPGGNKCCQTLASIKHSIPPSLGFCLCLSNSMPNSEYMYRCARARFITHHVTSYLRLFALYIKVTWYSGNFAELYTGKTQRLRRKKTIAHIKLHLNYLSFETFWTFWNPLLLKIFLYKDGAYFDQIIIIIRLVKPTTTSRNWNLNHPIRGT